MILKRQKEFTSLLFKTRAKIGRLRTDIAHKIHGKALEVAKAREKDIKKFIPYKSDSTRRLMPELGKVAQESDARINYFPDDTVNGVIPSKAKKLKSLRFGKNEKRGKKLIRDTKKGRNRYQIVYDGDPVKLSHELGHLKRRGKYVSRKNREIQSNRLRKGDVMERSGIKDLGNTWVGDKMKELEESGASKEGLKILEQAGASKPELEQAKELYDNALDTYKSTTKINALNILGNTIALPSRRTLPLSAKVSDKARRNYINKARNKKGR